MGGPTAGACDACAPYGPVDKYRNGTVRPKEPERSTTTDKQRNSRSAKLSWGLRVRLVDGPGLAVALRPEQLVVEFTDALQGGLEFLVVAQPLLDDGLLFG